MENRSDATIQGTTSPLEFAYGSPGFDLTGREKPPYIATGDLNQRLLFRADEDVIIKLARATLAAREELALAAEIEEDRLGVSVTSSSLEERIDNLYHTLFPERADTHLRYGTVNPTRIRALLERRAKKTIVDRADVEGRLMNGRKLRIKYGIDPTGGKIHIGHAVPLLMLRDLQAMGHRVIFLVGTFTAQIGDPSGRDQGRPELSDAQILENIATYKTQVSKILDVSAIEWVFNGDWYNGMPLGKFFDLLGNFTLAGMSARDFVASRVSKGLGVSIREFLYPVLQGWDSVQIRADIAVSGQDQEFNELQGRTLQASHQQPPQAMILTDLLEGTDGRKMSKSYDNCIYLTDDPDTMFTKVMRINDALISRYLKLATTVLDSEVAEIERALSTGENPLVLKQRLAGAMVSQYHDADAADLAGRRWQAQFLDHRPESIFTANLPPGEHAVVDLLVASRVAPSRSQARRQIQQGGVRVHGAKWCDPDGKLQLGTQCAEVVLRFGSRLWGRIQVQEATP